jgi:membrane protein required for colicin V production
MPTLDWIFTAVLLASLLLGAWRGLVYEVLSLAGWVAAFVLAQWFAPDVAVWLPMSGAGEQLRYAAGFVLVFVAAVFAAGLLAFLMGKLMSAVGLRPMDRMLGAVFGVVRGAVLILACALVVGMTPLQEAAEWQASAGARVARQVLVGLKPSLPQDFGKYLPS